LVTARANEYGSAIRTGPTIIAKPGNTSCKTQLWQRQGRRNEAHRALAAAYDTYTEGFTTPDLVDAKVLLESLAEPTSIFAA